MSRLLIAALLLPALLGLLPRPALSAAAQLQLALTSAICRGEGESGDQRQPAPAHHEDCALCASACATSNGLLPKAPAAGNTGTVLLSAVRFETISTTHPGNARPEAQPRAPPSL